MAFIPSAADEQLVREKQDQAIRYLKDTDLDAWMVFVREGGDAITTSIISGASYVVQNAAFIFTRDGRRIAILQPIDIQNKLGSFFDEVIPCSHDIDEVIARTLHGIDPRQLAVNYSKLEFCADGLTHGMYLRLKGLTDSAGLGDRIMSAEQLVASLRAIKTDEEISRIRKAAEITAAVANEVTQIMKPGVTEQDMAEFIQSRASHYGVERIGANVATNPIGQNDKGVKGRPIRSGEVIISDMGATYQGYGADLKRCWYALAAGENEIPTALADQWQACHQTLRHSLQELRAGRPGYEVHDAAWSFMESKGFARDGHSYGHQLGRTAHDAGPWLGDKDNIYRPAEGILQENMVVTLDPTMNRVGLNNPDFYCMGLEEMGIVGKTGGELVQEPQQDVYVVRL